MDMFLHIFKFYDSQKSAYSLFKSKHGAFPTYIFYKSK